MSVKFFRSPREVYKFDPETCKSFIFRAGGWQELNEPDGLEEIRYRTTELSFSEAIRRCGTEAA